MSVHVHREGGRQGGVHTEGGVEGCGGQVEGGFRVWVIVTLGQSAAWT